MRLHSPATDAQSAPADPPVVPARTRRSPLRRRLLWVGTALFVLALLIVTPPLVNANRYRKRIADTMSASLGRPVHLDDVSFHVLPVPGFTLRNLVVSEDPAFGAEPTIRADSVEATLRVSSLWHRPVEFSTVRFVNPSVNLVRNAEGRWNLTDVLLHASRVDSAPTAQRHAGPAPRFPYIEATSGRVNIKSGEEKLPFSLTEADFALWLPSARQWRVRLIGHPTRTDTNINDPGTVRLEGELRRADSAATVPVNFRATWHDAPLGEASRILTGEDRGWRGTLNLDATLTGQLGNAHMESKLTLGGLRRAEFFPTRPLDLQITCGSGFQLYPASLTGLQCTLPDDGPQPLTLDADKFDPMRPAEANATIHGDQIPVRWAMLWAALFSPRVPTDLHPGGSFAVDLVHGPVQPPAPAPQRSRRKGVAPASLSGAAPLSVPVWTGHVDLQLPAPGNTTTDSTSASTSAPENAGAVLSWRVAPATSGSGGLTFDLAPTQVRLGPGAAVTVSAGIRDTGYSVSVTGSAPAAALLQPARYVPQLGDGMEAVIPFPPTSTEPQRVNFTCTKTWGAAQTCVGPQSSLPARPAITPALLPGVTQAPAQLAPTSLSPLDHASRLNPR